MGLLKTRDVGSIRSPHQANLGSLCSNDDDMARFSGGRRFRFNLGGEVYRIGIESWQTL